jgi:hypothetical protein
MLTLLKLFVLVFIVFMAGCGSALFMGVGRMVHDADTHRHLMHHNVQDYHRLNNWRLK